MEELSLSKIKQLILNSPEKESILLAAKAEERQKFHTVISLNEGSCSRYKEDFFGWVNDFLDKKKSEMFRKMFQYPVYTTSLIESIGMEFMKVFNAFNSSFTYEFNNAENKSSFKHFIESNNINEMFKNDAFASLMTSINSIIIIDMPSDISSEIKPYYWFAPISSIKHVNCKNNIIEEIAILQENNNVLYINAYGYYLINGEEIIRSVPHELGYCPACFFWSTPISKENNIIKKSPFSSELSNLDWLLFWETSRHCLEIYASFPITVRFEDKCSYYEEKGGMKYSCENGIINRGDYGTIKCPNCENKRLIGAGSLIEVPAPQSKDDPNNLDAVKLIPAEINSLEYCKGRSLELWDEIYFNVLNTAGNDIQNQAVNEKQVVGSFEARQNTLLWIASNIQKSNEFVLKTMAGLMFGIESINSISVNYGNEFYLKTTSDSIKELKETKNVGSPQYFIQLKKNDLEVLTTKGDATKLNTINILKSLEPFPDLSLIEMKNSGLSEIYETEFLLKANFSAFIQQFENEYGSIILFGSKLDNKTKIQKIKSILYNYANEFKSVGVIETNNIQNGAITN